MNVARHFFTALTRTLRTTDDAKSLRQHLNTVNARHFGNGLKPAKLFAYFADLMGTANANKLTALLAAHTGPFDPAQDVVSRIDAALAHLMAHAAEYGKCGRARSENDPLPVWHMAIPLMTVTTTGNPDTPSQHQYYIGLAIEVSYSHQYERLIVDATLKLYDMDMVDFELSYECDFISLADIELYFSEAMEMGFGELRNVTLAPGVNALLPAIHFNTKTHTDTPFNPVLLLLTYGVTTQLLEALSPIATLRIEHVDLATHQWLYATASVTQALSSQT